MGYGIDPQNSTDLSPSLREKMASNLKHGAENYRAGRFDQAVEWYQGAAQIDSRREDVKQALEASIRMRNARQEALGRLPEDEKSRERYFQMALEASLRYQQEDKIYQAYNGLRQLWLTAGDYNGKTVAAIDQVRAQLKGRQAPAGAGRIEPALPGSLDGPPATSPAGTAGTIDAQTQADLMRAQTAMRDGHYDDARRTLEGVLGRDPLNQQARGQLTWMDQRAAAGGLPGSVTEIPANAQLQVAQMTEGGGETDDVTRLRVNYMLRQAEQRLAAGQLEEASSLVSEALKSWPTNEQARRLQEQIQRQIVAGTAATATGMGATAMSPVATGNGSLSGPERAVKIDGMHRQANLEYRNGNLARARELWGGVLQLDPENRLAQSWMENTAADYETMQAREESERKTSAANDAARALLNAPISLSTEREITLQEFVEMLSFTTPVDLEFYIAEGARAPIYASFKEKPLRTVLDTVLEPRGLSWTITESNVIVITQNLKTKTFALSPAQVSQLRTLLDAKKLQQLVWNRSEPPSENVDITLDERSNLLLVIGSDLHLQRIESLLPLLQTAAETDLIFRSYKIRESQGPRIRALINSIVQSKDDTTFGVERKIYIDGDDLLIRDTADNIKLIEDLLLDRGFIQMLTEEKIGIQLFSLIPKNVETIKSDEVQVFTSKVVEAIKVFLYAQGGESRAAEEGRRLWFDEASLTLTIVDTPSNLQRVSEYINSLPQISERSQSQVVRLRNAVAEDLAASLERILDLTETSDTGGGAGGGESTTIRLRRGQERTFRNLRIRLVRVEEGDVNDRNDDSAELSMNTGFTINQVTVRELETTLTDDYEITADDVLPSSGQPGAGSATITIRYVPRVFAQQQQAALQQVQLQQAQTQFGGPGGAPAQFAPQAQIPQQQQPTVEDQGITINPFGELNFLIIRYTNPQLFQEAMELIEQLDQPIRQVEIETKFVEVNENKAKEIGGDFRIEGLGSGRHIDWGAQEFNSRFAQERDMFKSSLDIPITSPFGPNYLQGATVIDAVIGGFPFIDYSLRMLEAQGVLNVVNGPMVTALDGREAEFRIETYTSTGDAPAANNFVDILNPVDTSNADLADFDEGTQAGNLLGAVVLRVTPEITSADSIILRDLSAELIDFDRFLNQLLTVTPQAIAGVTDQAVLNPILGPQAVAATAQSPLLKRKKIVTDARIANGGTIVIGGWTGERNAHNETGIPVLKDMPYFGKLLFSRQQWTRDRTTLLIFLTGNLVD
jgi:type II secretory pathway component GspD/PulD (secretin)